MENDPFIDDYVGYMRGWKTRVAPWKQECNSSNSNQTVGQHMNNMSAGIVDRERQIGKNKNKEVERWIGRNVVD